MNRKERRKEAWKKWYVKHRERHAEFRKNWYAKHPEYNKKRGKKNQQLLCLLKTNGCAICGYNKCNAALDFHHVNPEDKKFPVNRNTIARKNVIDEINKCILLCANCHREIEEKERQNER